jgi:hypothetical protein
MFRVTSLLISLCLFGCAPQPEPQQAPMPTRVWTVSIGGLSKNHDAYAGQVVRVKLTAGGYVVRRKAVIVPTVTNPSLSLITFQCEYPPLDASREISIRGIAQPLVRDNLNRGPGVAGEVVVCDCTVTDDSER